MNPGDWAQFAMAIAAIVLSALASAVHIGRRVGETTAAVDRANRGLEELKSQVRHMDDTYRSEQDRQWQRIDEHGRKLSAHAERLDGHDGRLQAVETRPGDANP